MCTDPSLESRGNDESLLIRTERDEATARTGGWLQVPWGPVDILLGVVTAAVGMLLALISVVGNDSVSPLSLGLGAGVLVGVVWLFTIRKYRVGWSLLGLRRPASLTSWLWPWLALVGSLVFASFYSATVAAAGLERLLPPTLPESILGHGLSKLLNVLVIGLVAPFTEEVFFRGFVMAGLARRLGVGKAVIATSALFGVAHGSIGVVIPLFVTGLLLSWLYLRTRSVWPPIVAHSAQNWLALLVAM